MAALPTSQLTLSDWAKRIGPDGNIAAVIELLGQTNELLDDAVFKEGNLPTGHRTTIRTGLPNVYWRALNAGIPPSKSTTAQVDETCGYLEARSHVDIRVANLNGNSPAFRLSEDSAFIEAMNQTQATTQFYGNPSTNPLGYLGLAPRYSSLSGGNAVNILSAGGASTNNTSIWLLGWGDNSIFNIFPKGSTAGLQHRDLGEDDVLDANGGTYRALKTLYSWDQGMVVQDWRYGVRICNVNTADLVAQATTQASTAATQIINLMARAVDRLPSIGNVRPAFYMNRTVHSMLRIAAMNKTSAVLSIESGLNQFGKPHSWTAFDGIPLRKSDGILNTESTVS
jgi:hypothetical protein